jgi:hypothetical protein
VNKGRAAVNLMRDMLNKRPSRDSYKRVRKSCEALGLNAEEAAFVEQALEYRSEDGELYQAYRGEA